MGAPDAKQERYICPLCQRTKGTDQSFATCDYCAENMVPMLTWVRRHLRKTKSEPEKESDK